MVDRENSGRESHYSPDREFDGMCLHTDLSLISSRSSSPSLSRMGAFSNKGTGKVHPMPTTQAEYPRAVTHPSHVDSNAFRRSPAQSGAVRRFVSSFQQRQLHPENRNLLPLNSFYRIYKEILPTFFLACPVLYISVSTSNRPANLPEALSGMEALSH